MKQTAISVIIPIYNVEKYVAKCVRSLFGQAFAPIEYLLVDDCSPDNSINIIKSILNDFPNRKEQCRFFHLDKNSGPATARNKGLENARGEYIYFCDADDWLDLTMLEKMYSLAKKERVDIVICDFYIVCENKKQGCIVSSWTPDKKASMRNYIEKEFNSIWNLLVRNDLYKDNHIAFVPGYKCAEDLNLSVKLFYKARKCTNLHEHLYYYNQLNGNSIMHRMDEKCLSDERVMCKKLLVWLENEGSGGDYADVLYWRILKGKQEYLLDTKTYHKFIDTLSESNKYILSCPYLNVKLKIMGWCLVHHLTFISIFLLYLRKMRLYILSMFNS